MEANIMRIIKAPWGFMPHTALLFSTGIMFSTLASANNTCTFSGTALDPINFGVINLGRDRVVQADGNPLSTVITRNLEYKCAPSGGSGYSIRYRGTGSYSGTSSEDIAIAPGIGLSIEANNIGSISASIVRSRMEYGLLDVASNASGTIPIKFQLKSANNVTPSGPYSAPGFVVFRSIARDAPFTYSPDSPPVGRVLGTISLPTCQTKALLEVNLPSVKSSEFTYVGEVVGATPFTISLDCPAGNPVSVFMTLTDNLNASNRTSILSIRSGPSYAQGVGIQINRGASVVKYGPDSVVASNVNQFLTEALIGTPKTISIPLSASYVSSGAVKAGVVSAIATYTLSYR